MEIKLNSDTYATDMEAIEATLLNNVAGGTDGGEIQKVTVTGRSAGGVCDACHDWSHYCGG